MAEVNVLTSDRVIELFGNFVPTIGLKTALNDVLGGDVTGLVAKVNSPDAKITSAITTTGTATQAALNSTYVGQDALAIGGLLFPATASHTDVQAALDSAATSGMKVVCVGNYTTTSTLVITSDCDLSGLTVTYTGAGVAVQIGNGSSGVPGILFNKNIKTPYVINGSKVGLGWAAGTTGVRVVNAYACTIHLGRVSNFETGCNFHGLGTGTVYNIATVTHLDNNKHNLVVSADATGWANSNTYLLGRLSHQSAEGVAVTGVRHIVIEYAPNPVNANLFIGGSVEASIPDYHLECDGAYNEFRGLRWENGGGGGCRVLWGAHSVRNLIHYGYAAHTIVETHTVGSAYNQIKSAGVSRTWGTSTKALQVWENSNGLASPVDSIMGAGATILGSDSATEYAVMRSANSTGMKRPTDTYDRLRLDHQNGRVYFGNGALAPSMYVSILGTAGIAVNNGDLYFAPDNTKDLGLITSYRPRYIRAATATVTGSFATGSRPPATTAGVGASIFDSTLGKPIWSTGSAWVDATGTTV